METWCRWFKFCCAWICGDVMAIQEIDNNWKENLIGRKHVDEMDLSNCIYRVDKIKNLIEITMTIYYNVYKRLLYFN